MNSLRSYLNLLRRVTGGVLIVLVMVPFWRLLSSSTAPIATEAIRLTDSYSILLLQGTVAVLVVAAVVASFLSADSAELTFTPIGKKLESFGGARYSIVLATLSALMTAALSAYVWDTKPVLVDALAQVLHARYYAAGMLAGPPGLPYEFWVSTNTLVTDQGWVSQYPPGHMLALAAGFAVRALWVVCPALMGIAVFFTGLTADRLFPEDKIVARVGTLLFAASPFLMGLAAAFMSHVTVVALLAVAAYCALRARDGTWLWALATGLAVGGAFATRSLSAIVIGAVLTLGVWLTGVGGRERSVEYLSARLGAAILGAVPIAIAVAAYNAHFFGSPFEFGYTAYLGPDHGLGYHLDPFGNPFGPIEGLAFISSDLAALGYYLLRTPVSVVLVVGIFLVVAARLSLGARIVTAWALCLILPYAAYWHHDLVLGPRMISDVAPAWCLLTTVAGFGLVRLFPRDKVLFGGRFSPRVFVSAVFGISLVLGTAYFVPHDVRVLGRTFAPAPTAPHAESPTIVFVHGAWTGRIGAILVGQGMRADSVNVSVTVNSTCALQQFTDRYVSTGVVESDIQVSFTRGVTDGSAPTRLENGVVIRAKPDEQLTPACLIQTNSDRGGAVPLMPLLWQGDLPGIGGTGAMYVRDLGPNDNDRLIARYPGRRLAVLLRHPDDGNVTIVPYETGMELLWGDGSSEEDGG